MSNPTDTPIEARGVRCLECKGLSDLKADLDLSATGFGKCAVPVAHFVSFAMARNCLHFEAAPDQVAAARDRWVDENVVLFWRRK